MSSLLGGDQGVVGDACFLKRLHHLANHPNELVNEVAVDTALAGALEALRRIEGVVDRSCGEKTEEGLFPPLS